MEVIKVVLSLRYKNSVHVNIASVFILIACRNRLSDFFSKGVYGNACVNYGCVNSINAAVFTMHVYRLTDEYMVSIELSGH